MVQSQYSLSWNDYKSNICNGFSLLQQNGEMVDMTLAADGHIVKVHQVLLALASPYLKELITSAPCQHPVIFLNDVSYRTLTALLEYIYTGEVLVAAENLPLFVKTAKNLHIKGLEDLNIQDENMHIKFEDGSRLEDLGGCHISGTKKMTLPETEGGLVDLPASARKVLIKREKQKQIEIRIDNKNLKSAPEAQSFMDDTAADHDSDGNFELSDHDASSNKNVQIETGQLQYSVSIRGSLQVILNRYIYNLQNTQSRSGMKRWRCIDYRNRKCFAFLVTKGNVVLNRANLHNHSFHDKKILQKIEKKAVYSAITDVEGYKENEHEENITMDQEDLSFSYDYEENSDAPNK